MKVAPVSRRWGAALVLASLGAAFAVPSAQAAAPVERSQAVNKALSALKAHAADDALTVFALRSTVPAGTEVTQAGPDTTVAAAARNASAPTVSARLARAGVKAFSAGQVIRTTERSWFLYADEGPSQAFEHPGRVVVVGQRSGKVTVTERLRWVPLVDGRLPAFFRTAAAHEAKTYRVFDRAWKQRSAPAAAPKATAAQASPAASDAQKRLADALANERSCALRVSDTLGDFYDFARVDKTRAALGRVLTRLARLNDGFVTERYRASGGATPIEAAQRLISRGCGDLLLYVTGSGTKTGAAGIVVGLRAAGGGVQWHTVSAKDVETLVRDNRNVAFKLVFDAPYAGRMAEQLKDEKNVTVLLTPGGPDDPSFTYLPQILGGQGVVTNTTNPTGLLEFTNELIVGMERFAATPDEIDHAIAERAAGRSDSVLAWMLARALDLAPSPFTAGLLGTSAQRVPVTSPAASRVRPPLNHAPLAVTPPQFTREDVVSNVTLLALDGDLDPLTFQVVAPPSHGTFSGTAPFLRYTPDRDFHGFDSFTYRVSDGRGGVAEQTVVITVISDNDAPAVVSGPSSTPPTYVEQQASPAAVVVDNALTVTDPDSANLVGAKAEIVAGRTAGDVLAATPPAGIAASYDAATGVLTFTGTASRAAYQSALRSVTFRSTSDDPGTARTIRFTPDDGDELGLAANRDVVVTPLNDAPAITVPGQQDGVEDTPLVLAGPDKVSVADADARADAIEVTLSSGPGSKLHPATAAGLTVTGDDTATLKLHGPQAAINTALDGLTYTPAPDATATDTVTVAASDLGRNGTGGTKTDTDTFTITLATGNDAPVNTVPGPLTIAEDAAATALGAFSVADVDAGADTVTARLQAAHGTLDVALSGATITGDGSKDVTVRGTLTEVNTSLATVTYTVDGDHAGADTVTLTTTDEGHNGAGGAQTDVDTIAVTVTPVNDAPVLTAPGADPLSPVAVTEDTAKTFAAGGADEISVADVDAGTGDVQATVDADAGTLSAGITLPGLDVSGTNTGTLVLTGTLAEVNDALDGLTYAPPTDASGPTKLEVAVTDNGHTGAGGAGSDAATVNLAIGAVNDKPVLAPPTGSVAYAEGGTAAVLAPALTVTDADDTDLESARVAIAAGFQDGDELTFADAAGITESYDDTTGVLTLTGTAPEADYQALLRSVAFSTEEDDPAASRTVELTANDGAATSDAATRTVTITPQNDAPTVAAGGGSAAFVEDAGPVAIAPALTVADADDTHLHSATVAIIANHDAATDVLAFAPQHGITVQSWSPATGTLALTGTATEAEYEDALRSVTFTATGDTPGTATRTVSFTVADGDATSAASTRGVTVDDVNDAPQNTVPGAQSVTEDAALTFDGARKISVADVDAAAGDELTVTVTVTGGTFDLAQTAGLTFTTGDGDDEATATFAGTTANLNAALDGLVYTPTPGTSGSRELQITTDDEGHTGGPAKTDTDTVAIAVDALNRAPVNHLPSAQTTDEDDDLVLSTGNGNAIGISDADAGSAVVETALGVTNGTLTLAQTTGLTVEGGANGTSFVHISGTVAAINAALDGLTYAPTPDHSGGAVLSIATEDRGNTGVGGTKSDSDTLAITVSAVNDAPQLTAPAAATVAEEGSVTFSTGNVNAISVADVDAGSGSISVDLTATHGTVTLGSTAGVTVTGNGTSAVGVTGARTAVNAALEGTTFTGAIDFDGAAQLKVDVSDQGHTGSGGARTDTHTIAVTVTGENDAPSITAPTSATVNQSSQRTFSTGNGNAISIADVDAGAGPVRVTLGVAHGTLSLAQTSGLTFTTGDGSDDPALVFTGTLSAVNAALDGLVYEPTPGYDGAEQLDIDVSDQGNTGAGGALTDAADVAITVLEANSPPVNTVPGAQTLNEDTTKAFAGADKLAVSDANVDPATGVLEVDLDVDHGVLSLDGTAGLTFTVGDGASNTAMTFRGTPNAINAALDGMTYTPAPNYAGGDTLTLVTDDLGASGPPSALQDTDTVTLTIAAQNDPPSLTAPAAIAADEDVTQAIAGVSVADVDAGSDDLELRLAVSNGTLSLTTTTGLTFTTGDGSADAVIVARGTVGELSAALGTLAYRGAADASGSDTLELDVDDLGHNGAGGPLTDSEDVPVTVAAVNDAPVNTLPGAQTVDEDTALTLSGANAISVADVDAASLTVTLATSGGTLSLGGTAGLTFTTGNGVTNPTMTFSGTKAAINAALDGLAFTPTPNSNGATAIQVTTSDAGATGSGGTKTDADTLDVTVTPVNDAPALTQPDGTTLTYTEDTPSENHELAIAPNLTVTDVDDTSLASATVTIGALAAGDQLTFTDQNGIAGSYSAGTLTLTGSASLASYQTALRSVKFRTTSENPDTTQRTITFSVDDGHAQHHDSNDVTRTLDVVRTNDAPVADDETFTGGDRAIGNTSLVVNDPTDGAPDPTGTQKEIAGDILAGDQDVDSPTSGLSVAPVTNAATTGGGRITIEADGDFTYLPEQGCDDATDTYDYTLNDNDPLGNRTDTGTLTFSIADCVWYVDASGGAQPTATGGTSQAPYNTLADLDSAGGTGDEDGTDDRIFLYDGAYSGPLPLENGQHVLTQRHGLAVSDGAAGSVVLHNPAPGDPVSSLTGGVTAAANNTIQGLTFGAAGTGFALSGSNVGTLTVNTVTSGGLSNATGGAVSIGGTGNVLDVALSSISSGGGTNAISLAGASGTFTAGSGTLANASGPTVSLSSSPVNFTLDASVVDDTGQLVSISGSGSGTKRFDGLVSDQPLDGDGGGVSLTNNGSATIRFEGGLNLSTGTTNAFAATGGGTVAVRDPAGAPSTTLETTSGTPLTVTNTTIHADDLTFERISSNGAPNGILLNTTGSDGGLNVTGTGGTCTAASPACTGGQILESTGAGVVATNVGGGVSLANTRIHSGDDDGIRATTVTNMQVASSVVTGNGDAAQERGLDYENVTGSATFNASYANTNWQDNLRIHNTSGSVDYDVVGSEIDSALHGDGFQVFGDGSATMKTDISASKFRNSVDDGFQLLTSDATSATMHLNFSTNQLSANSSQVNAGALVTLSPGGNATTKVSLTGNQMNTSKGANLILNPAGASSFDAIVEGNQFANGFEDISGIPRKQSQARIRIANNTLTGHKGYGMYLTNGEGSGGRADFTVYGNTISNPGPTGLEGIYIEAGVYGSDDVTMCADIGGPGGLANNIGAASGNGVDDVALTTFSSADLILPGLIGSPETFIAGRNNGPPTVANGGGNIMGGAACQTPSAPPAP